MECLIVLYYIVGNIRLALGLMLELLSYYGTLQSTLSFKMSFNQMDALHFDTTMRIGYANFKDKLTKCLINDVGRLDPVLWRGAT